MDNGSRPFCLDNEDIKRVLLNCPQTKEMENYVYEQKRRSIMCEISGLRRAVVERPSLIWDVTRRWLVVGYRRFGMAYRVPY